MNDKLNKLLEMLIGMLEKGAEKLPAAAEVLIQEAYMRQVLTSGVFAALGLLIFAATGSRS